MSVGVTLMWPLVAVLGFAAVMGVVVALGASSTARYEFERNGAREPQRSAARGRTGAHPAGSRAPERQAEAADAEPRPQAQPQAVGVALRPAAPPAAGATPRTGWWLVAEADDGTAAEVVAGSFADRLDADWAALATGLAARAAHGVLRPDGGLVLRPSPAERAWLAELGEQLDRLPEDWDELLTDTDPLTTLVVEVAAALVEAGMPLYDFAQPNPAGGVCLTPEPACRGVLVAWRPHDRMSVQRARGAAAEAAVQHLMNATIADVLEQLGFVVERFGSTGCTLVTALRG